MAASVALPAEGLPASASLRPRTRHSKTGLDDVVHFLDCVLDLEALVDDLPVYEADTLVEGELQQRSIAEQKWELYPQNWINIALPIGLPPPSYSDSIYDLPPDYTTTESVATANVSRPNAISSPFDCWLSSQKTFLLLLEDPFQTPKVDFSAPGTYRTHVKKKAKQAAKKAGKDKWASDDEDEKKEGEGEQQGDGGGNEEGGGGGADGGGGGGDDGNGNGDDGDDWDFGNSKKKKKGKKGKNAFDEDEEEKKREEEEAAAAAFANDGFGDAAAPVDANPDDEWGGFTAAGGKKKKGKKGKGAEPAPPPPPPPPDPPAAVMAGESNFDDIALDDGAPKLDLSFGATETKTSDFGFSGGGWGGWGAKTGWGFGSGGDGAVNKGEDDASKDAAAEDNGMWGSAGGKKNKKKTDTGFNFDFDNSNADDAAVVDVVTDAQPAEGDGWGFATAGKNKKGKKGGAAEEPAVVVVPEPDPEPAADMGWGWGTSKKDKKKKKGGAADIVDVPPPPPPPPPPVAPADPPVAEVDELWGYETQTKKGKKGKKGKEEIFTVEDPIVVVPEPEPIVVATEPAADAAADDTWGGWGSSNKKDKKNKKKGIKDEPSKPEEPAVVVVPEPDPIVVPEADAAAYDPWGNDVWGNAGKKNKKGNKKGPTVPEPSTIVDDPIVAVVTEDTADAAATTVNDDDWMNWGSTNKKDKKKKGKGGAVEDIPPPAPPPPPAVPDPVADTSNDWGSFGSMWGGSKKDKDKKGKNSKTTEAPPPPPPEPDPLMDFFDDSVMKPDAVVEPKAEGEDDWSSGWGFGKNKDKKNKNSNKNAPVEVVEETLAIPSQKPDSITEFKSAVEEDSWGMWGSSKNKKKGKKGATAFDAPPPAPTPPDDTAMPGPDLVVPPPPPEPPLAIEASGGDAWDSFATVGKKGKKDKKSTLSKETSSSKASKGSDTGLSKQTSKESKGNPDDIVQIIEEVVPPPPVEEPKKEEPAKPVSKGWGFFGGGSTSKSKTSKEKEKREKEEKERKEREEKERLEKEEAERARKEAEEAARRKAEEDELNKLLGDPDEIVDIIDEAPAKKGKKKKGGAAQVETKAGKKSITASKADDIVAIVDVPASYDDPIIDIIEEPKFKKDDKRPDTWGSNFNGGSFWGVSLKSTKKAEPKKEIDDSAAHDIWIGEPEKVPEPPPADEPTLPPKLSKATATKAKTTAKGAVADRIKALQGGKNGIAEQAPPPPPPPPPVLSEPLVEILPEPPAVETVKSVGVTKKSTSKSLPKSTSNKKQKEVSPELVPKPLVVPEPASVGIPAVSTPVPGGFPDDDIINIVDLAPPPPLGPAGMQSKTSKKADKKSAKKGSKGSKETPDVVDVPPPPPPIVAVPVEEVSREWGSATAIGEHSKYPTPPPEPAKDGPASPPKKERARVVRNQGASSWGFWGAAPKQDVKKKPGDTATPSKPKPSTPALTRSKSARKASDRDPEKSSESDKAAKTPSRPKSSRAGSFSFFGGGPPPSRSRSMRASATTPKSSSRRASVDHDTGMMSPPTEDVLKVSAKAAKVMGIGNSRPSVNRRQSTREKGKTRSKTHDPLPQEVVNRESADVPDPYAIDDDIVMVDRVDDFGTPLPPPQPESRREAPKDRSSKKRSKRDSRISGGDDAVLVDIDAPGPSDGAEVVTGPDDITFVEAPRKSPMKRSASAAQKSGGFMGLFGLSRRNSTRPAETDDRRNQRTVYESEDGMSRRKRSSGRYEEDSSKRVRRDDRKIHRRKVSDTDGFATDAAPAAGASATTDAEDAEARKARRDVRATERTEAEERAARRRERDRAREVEQQHEARRIKAHEARDRRLREEQALEARRQEEKRARRERRAQDEQARRNEEAREADRRARRRERERERNIAGSNDPPSRPRTSDRPKSDRHRSHMDKPARTPDGEAIRHQRHDERRAQRTPGYPPADKSSHRRSTAGPVDDYFDPRNGQHSHGDHSMPQSAPGRPYLANGDKTSSWVHSINAEPPLPPPVEGTVIEGAPDLHGGDDTADEDAVRREMRRMKPADRKGSSYRHEKKGGGRDDRRRDERRSGGDGIRSSDGSGGLPDRVVRRKSAFPAFGDGVARAWDDRPAGPAKRGSWFKKIAGF